ncbi:MAG: methylmalonyl-CoA mutase family protein [Limisphaerales bacterium]
MTESKNPSSAGTGTPERLLAGFAPVSRADWRKLVDVELKGAPFEKRMLTSTYEGITLQPLYCQEDIASIPHVSSFPGFAPFVRGATASGYLAHGWHVSQEITGSSPMEFNDSARHGLGRGLTALNLVVDQATRNGHDPDWAKSTEVGCGGVSISTLGDLERALDGIDLEKSPLFVRTGASGMPFAALLAALSRKQRKSTAWIRGCIETDPLGVLAHESRLPQSLPAAYREMAALTKWAAEHAPQLQTICVHSRAWHESGGSAVQELAFTLATAVDYLRALAALGLPVEIVAPRLRFSVTVGENFFTEIAKLRALRLLWSHLVAALGGDETAQRASLHVRTSLWNKTVYDPYNNLLRTTVEAFAGVLGGCDSMQVGAFDEVLRTPDDISQRIARNTQLVLQKECNLDQVIDPAGGSWYVESLTAELATRAWALFQEVETRGGMAKALETAFPQQSVARTAAEKIKNVTRRRDSIVGINQYANPKEKPLDRPILDAAAFHQRRVQHVTAHRTSLDQAAATAVLQKLAKIVEFDGSPLFEASIDAMVAGATLGEVTRAIRINDQPAAPLTPVCLTRAAVPFEALRAAMDRQPAAAGARPKAFLCNLGPLGQHKARADFSRGFLATGGYEVISPAGFETPAAAADAFAESGARVAVICSTDDTYPLLVPPLVQAIRAKAPDAIVLLAGYPTDQVEAHRQTGVDDFIHLRADAAVLLKNLHAKLGIA